MRKMVLKKCLYFISFYKVHALCWIKFIFLSFFFFDMLLFFTRICLHKAQNNMFSALKSKPKTKNWDGKTANNELSEHKTYHISLTPYYLTTCEAPFKFVLAISQATDPSTTVFFHFSLFNICSRGNSSWGNSSWRNYSRSIFPSTTISSQDFRN